MIEIGEVDKNGGRGERKKEEEEEGPERDSELRATKCNLSTLVLPLLLFFFSLLVIMYTLHDDDEIGIRTNHAWLRISMLRHNTQNKHIHIHTFTDKRLRQGWTMHGPVLLGAKAWQAFMGYDQLVARFRFSLSSGHTLHPATSVVGFLFSRLHSSSGHCLVFVHFYSLAGVVGAQGQL